MKYKTNILIQKTRHKANKLNTKQTYKSNENYLTIKTVLLTLFKSIYNKAVLFRSSITYNTK